MTWTWGRTRRLLQRVMLVCLSAAFVFEVYFFRDYPTDDAFIFMRIARNFAAKGAPYFNIGERVMGHSSHLWLWFVTFLFRLFGPRPEVVLVGSIALTIMCLWLTAALLGRCWPRFPELAIVTAAILMQLFLVPYVPGLMETPLAVAVLLGAFWMQETGRERGFGFMAGLCFLTRYEFGLVAVLGFLLSRRRMDYFKGLAGPIVLFLAFTLSFYGTVIPETALAKHRIYSGGRQTLLPHFAWPWTHSNDGDRVALKVLIALALVAIVLALRHLRPGRTGPRWPIMPIVMGLTLLGLYGWSDVVMFFWYWPLMLFPLMLGAAGAVRSWRTFALPVVMLACVSPKVMESWDVAHGHADFYFDELRVHQYLAIGAHLAKTAPGSTMLTSEIGALGWGFYPNKVIDADGLVTPANLKYHPMAVPQERSNGLVGSIPPQSVRDFRPDFIVSMDCFSEALRRSLVRGQYPYRQVERWPDVSAADTHKLGVDSVFGTYFIDVYARGSCDGLRSACSQDADCCGGLQCVKGRCATSPGEDCQTSADCVPPAQCYEYNGSRDCLLPKAARCAGAHGMCVSNMCRSGACVCSQFGWWCTASSDCCGGRPCIAGACR